MRSRASAPVRTTWRSSTSSSTHRRTSSPRRSARRRRAGLERELGAAIARIREGDFKPTPSPFACSGCPALDRVCAGPALLAERRAALRPRARAGRGLTGTSSVSRGADRGPVRHSRQPPGARGGARRCLRPRAWTRSSWAATCSGGRFRSSASSDFGASRRAWVAGNCERDVLHPDQRADRWCHAQLDDETALVRRDLGAERSSGRSKAWGTSSSVTRPLGTTSAIVTTLTSDDDVRDALRRRPTPTVVVCGHTHVQFDRSRPPEPRASSMRGAWVFRTRAGRERAGRSSTAGSSCGGRRTTSSAPSNGSSEPGSRRSPISSRTHSVARRRPTRRRSTSRAAVARSYVAEARRRGLGRRTERIGPIVERLAAEHADATIALRFSSDLDLLVSVMLSAQTTDVNVNRVTKELFRKYRRPEDYLAVPAEELERDIYATGLLPAEDEVDPRRDAGAPRGVRRAGAAHPGRAPATPGRGAKDGERRRGRARASAGRRRRHARAAALTAARTDAARGSGQDRARPPARRARARTGGGSRTC